MANTSSAKKAMRQAEKRTHVNNAHRSAYKQARKEVLKSAGSKEETTKVSAFYKQVDKAAKVGAISKNAARRYKSRVMAKLKPAK